MSDYPLTYRSTAHPDRKGKRCRVVRFSRPDGFVNAGNYREVTFEFEDGVRLVAPQGNAVRRHWCGGSMSEGQSIARSVRK